MYILELALDFVPIHVSNSMLSWFLFLYAYGAASSLCGSILPALPPALDTPSPPITIAAPHTIQMSISLPVPFHLLSMPISKR